MSQGKEELQRLRDQVIQLSDQLDAERIGRKLPKNLDFVQVARSELRAIGELGGKNPLALKVLMMLAQSMNKQNAVVMSSETMQQLTGKSRSTLSRAVAVLKKDNWVQVIKVGTANAYVLNEAVFWTDRGDKRKYASFTAQVVTTLDEQEKDLRACQDVKLQKVPMVEKNERVVLDDQELPPPDQQDIALS